MLFLQLIPLSPEMQRKREVHLQTGITLMTKTSSVLVQNYQIVSLPSLLFLNHNRSMFIPTKEL